MWTLGSVLFLVLVGSSVSRTSGLNISAEPGQNIVLPCGDPNINQVLVLEWIRSDLQEDEFVFSYRDEKVEHEGQHESFKDRVFLKNCQMKDGDLSVVLTNVKIKDSGIYECRVRQRNDSLRETKLISTINLQVSPPDQISAGSGDDVILSCRDPNINQVSVLKWTRTDLQEDGGYVTFRMNNSAGSEGRPESFKNRVFLKNNQMKDGDLSVVLKNLKIEDSGRYECRVMKRRSKRSVSDSTLISSIHLQVSSPLPEHGHLGLIAASVLVVLVLLPVVLWISKKKRSSIQSSIKHQNPEDGDCI